MTPETAAFLQKAREFLAKAQGMLDNQWPDEAGRAAYFAGLHAARAFIFENTGEVTKSHRRAQSEFGRLTKNDPRFESEMRAFLGRAFNFKALADYETGPAAQVSAENASEAIETAGQFVARVVSVLSAAIGPDTKSGGT